MFKQFLDQANGHQGYMIASLAIFFAFFLMVAVLLLVMKKETIKYMSNLPLDDDQK